MKTNNTTIKKAVGYCRYNQTAQAEESIESQKQIILAFAKKEGLEIVNWYIDCANDEGVSRKEFERMMKDSRTGAFQFVIVSRMDRFSRKHNESFFYKYKLSKYKVKTISASEIDTLAGRFTDALIEEMSMFFSQQHSASIKRGIALAKERKQQKGENDAKTA